MFAKKLSLRIRLFIAMIFLILAMSGLVAALTYFRYIDDRDTYNSARLVRKEESTRLHVNIELEEHARYSVKTKNIPKIFKTRIYDVSKVHNLDVAFYDLRGKLLISSVISFENSPEQVQLGMDVLSDLKRNENNRIAGSNVLDDTRVLQYSYTYILDDKQEAIAILKLQYTQDNTDQEEELSEFLVQLMGVYLVMLILGIVVAYFISSYVTGPLQALSQKLDSTDINRRNEKINLNNPSSEIYALIESYNRMVDELEASASKLAKSEREQAWREMAKQVAHEIKNPLTPMRLTVQSFERKYDPKNPETKERFSEFCQSLVEQIDVMSSIASAFSDFAKMPSQKTETLNVIDVVSRSLDIFQEDYIRFNADDKVIEAELDRTQLIRVITNLVTNALHAVEGKKHPKILVKIRQDEKFVMIDVVDNGKGISEEFEGLIFEPKFTTKNSGMGLGLPMIKNIVENYGGSISFLSRVDIGTTFTVELPKKEES